MWSSLLSAAFVGTYAVRTIAAPFGWVLEQTFALPFGLFERSHHVPISVSHRHGIEFSVSDTMFLPMRALALFRMRLAW